MWAFFRWTDVDSEYILRLHVVKTPWFAVCLHWIQKPDAEPWLHDHPVTFLSLILRGGYAEKRQRLTDLTPRHVVHRWFNFVRASDFDRHTIVFCRKRTLTLCLMGPKTREWGFHMPEGWVYWKDYYARLRNGEDMRDVFGKCEEEEAKQHADGVFVQPMTRPLIEGFTRCCLPFRKPVSDDFDDEAPTVPR